MIENNEMLLRLLFAAIAGGIIGFERKKLHKPAGLRTHMLVCAGSTLFILLTLQSIPTEAGRIIAGVATGIGFLGAGTIFRAENHVKGLTTAASIWSVAGVGLAVGLGQYYLAAIATILIIVVLELNKLKIFREV